MIVNTEKDDLRKAIAKMGGIQLDGDGFQAGYLWGSMARDAQRDKRFNFVPGVGLVLKLQAGLPVDRIAAYLFELDYLKSDDLTELEEALTRTISGALIYSAQKSDCGQGEEFSDYGDYPEFDAPEDDEEPEEVKTRTAEEIDAYGDIIAFLMGDIDELPSDTANGEPSGPVQNIATPESDQKQATSNELPAPGRNIKGARMKLARSEWITERLSRASPESRETVKRLIIGTLEAMERKRGIDLTAEKKAVADS
jgi:hypothetical protein